MKSEKAELPGVVLIQPDVFGDSRGYFVETWHKQRYEEAGIPGTFVQDNMSYSERGVLRGLHFQNPQAQGKLVSVIEGEIYDVAVDIRVGSPTFGRWVGVTLSRENRRQMFVPEGCAHGFCVVSPAALVTYKCTALYARETEASVLWNDPAIGVKWPIEQPTLSAKDQAALTLDELLKQGRLPKYLEPR
jgi:dTDP-4-dehydrorhamnose 3,5-epimerase